MKKRFLSLTLVMFILLAAPAYAAPADGGTTTLYKASYNPGAPFCVELEHGQIVFSGLSPDASNDFLWLWLLDDSGNKYADSISARGADNRTAFSLEGLRDGTYYVQLYTNSARNGTFYSIIWDKDITLRVSGGAFVFVLPPVYAHNMSVYSAARTDRTALDYYLQPEKDIQSDNSAIITLARTITGGLNSDYEKIMAVHDWVAQNIWYDNDVLHGRASYGNQSALETLKRNRGVCSGYANLAAALLRASGIPAKYITGYVLGLTGSTEWTERLVTGNDENHAWTEAFADGRWIIFDATWDSGNKYENGKNTKNDGLTGYRYFDVTPEFFSIDHKITYYPEMQIPKHSDLPSSWAAEHITRAAELGIYPEALQKSYRTAITRAEFCALAVALFEAVTGTEIAARKQFMDTDDVNVEKMGGLDVISGIGDGMFQPSVKLTRQEAAVILAKLSAALGKPLETVPSTFADTGTISSWALDAVGQVQAAKIMNGSANRFTPWGDYTREQSVSTLLKIYELCAG